MGGFAGGSTSSIAVVQERVTRSPSTGRGRCHAGRGSWDRRGRLLFAHWSLAAELEARVPPQLALDTFEGEAGSASRRSACATPAPADLPVPCCRRSRDQTCART